MASRKEKAPEPEAKGVDPNAWMATFSDLLTLMLTFFVLLLTMSSMDNKALKDTFGFFNAKMGLLKKVATQDQQSSSALPVNSFLSQQVFTKLENSLREKGGQTARMAMLVEHLIDENNLEDIIQVRSVPGGIAITIAATALFIGDSLKLSSDGMAVMDSIADLIKEHPNLHLKIDGIQQKPMPKTDPWQLAIDRALALIDYLIRSTGADSHQLAVSGYGPGWEFEGLPDKAAKINMTITWFEKPLHQ